MQLATFGTLDKFLGNLKLVWNWFETASLSRPLRQMKLRQLEELGLTDPQEIKKVKIWR